MRYVFAVLCPPVGMALAHRPFRALLSTMGLVMVAATWPTVFGFGLLAGLMLWSCKVVGEVEADDDVDGFLQAFNRRKVKQS